MKTLRIKTLSAALMLSLFALSAAAQPQQGRGPQRGGERQTPEKMAEIMTDEMDQKLELTDAQESKILAINLKYAKLREENKPERGAKPEADEPKAERPDREAMKEKMEEQMEAQKAHMLEIMKVLSDEQKVEYALMLAHTKGQQHGQRGEQGRRGPQGKECNEGKEGKGKEQDEQPKGKQRNGEPRPERPAPDKTQPQE
ncbi:MAG: DUF4890 domain-containing protein [Rikenellaceae bacterium]